MTSLDEKGGEFIFSFLTLKGEKTKTASPQTNGNKNQEYLNFSE